MSSSENLEAIVIQWLNDLVPGYPASSDTPEELPEQFILVERTGGAREAIIGDNAEILIEVYDKDSRYDCSEIANFIGDHIMQLVEDNDNITHAAINSIISLDDTKKQYHRYQIYCDIFHSRINAFIPDPPEPPEPQTTSITVYYGARQATSWTVGSLNNGRRFDVVRSPEDTRSDISVVFNEQSEKFNVSIEQQDTTLPHMGKVTITQTTTTSPRRAITASFMCGSAVALLTINPK